MAISIEQEKKEVNWLNIILAIIIIVSIFVGTYLLFFKKPELIEEVVISERFRSLSEFSKVEFDPQEVLNSPNFKVLRQFQIRSSTSEPGKSNPFEPLGGIE
jgi:hypothetical protein